MTRNRFGAALLVACCTITALAMSSAPAAASSRHAGPSCSLASVTLGGADVVFLNVAGVQHGAWFQVDWVEPQITQVQYMWSTSSGVLQDDVLNDQGSGTYTASVWSLDKRGNPVALETTCSAAV